MNRKELYKEITSLGLQEEVKSRFGRNYTQCTNSQLLAIVMSDPRGPRGKKATPECLTAKKKEESRLNKLIESLYRKRILLKSEIDYINS